MDRAFLTTIAVVILGFLAMIGFMEWSSDHAKSSAAVACMNQHHTVDDCAKLVEKVD